MLEERLKTQAETARWSDGIAQKEATEVDHVGEILPVDLKSHF